MLLLASARQGCARWSARLGTDFRRGQSMFVRKAKMMDYWQNSEDALEVEFDESDAIVMVDKEPLVLRDRQTVSLVRFTTKDLKDRLNQYGLEIGLLNSTLLDCSCPSESQHDFKPLFGSAVRTLEPPPDSGIRADRLRQQLAHSLGGSFVNMRLAMLTLSSQEDRHLLARMQAVTRWYLTYRRCPTCSTPLRLRPSKSSARCIRCDRFFYPTISPVAICLVRSPDDEQLLLVRHRGSVPTVYTLVAGFAAAGESLHDTARREVAEEVGLEAAAVRMLDVSQPWPMPFNSLMCGFTAVAQPDQPLEVCADELETAGWFSREQVAEALRRVEADPGLSELLRPSEQRDPNAFHYVPPHGAVAHQIIKNWVLGGRLAASGIVRP